MLRRSDGLYSFFVALGIEEGVSRVRLDRYRPIGLIDPRERHFQLSWSGWRGGDAVEFSQLPDCIFDTVLFLLKDLLLAVIRQQGGEYKGGEHKTKVPYRFHSLGGALGCLRGELMFKTKYHRLFRMSI